jgi:voltage-gated potassium channel Kch
MWLTIQRADISTLSGVLKVTSSESSSFRIDRAIRHSSPHLEKASATSASATESKSASG